MINFKNQDNTFNKWWLLLIIVVAFCIILLLGILGILAFEVKYQDKFFPGTKIGSTNLEGLTRGEAINQLDVITEKIKREGIILVAENSTSTLTIKDSLSALNDPDLSVQLIDFDNHQTVAGAMAVGREGGVWQKISNQWQIITGNYQFQTHYRLNEQVLINLLQENFSPLESPYQNPKPIVNWDQLDNFNISLAPEAAGIYIDYPELIAQIKSRLATLDNNDIAVKTKTKLPSVTKDQAYPYIYLAEDLLATSTPAFVYEENEWNISKKNLSGMLIFEKSQDKIILSLEEDSFKGWIEKNIAPDLNIEPRNAKIEIANGKVKELVTHRDGQKINLDQTYNNAKLVIAGQQPAPIKITVEIQKPDTATEDINDMGIKEIIGIGHSNFAGSPPNRIHNIRNGANKIHGTLIKPGEEFSLIKTLGDIDASTGYLPELVIKDGRTIPEYGGGLCQIGTTMFRSAMESALPITERRNHSYNVSYYLENGLPGTDATIYIPHPDVRFVNDTENYILIQTRVEGYDVYFDFWGTEDGRESTRTTPKVWGWTNPPPTKYIETTDLAPGQKKCTESSHKGVSASFDYTINYPDGREDKTTFSSYYKPWQAVCLIGVEEKPEPEQDQEDSIPENDTDKETEDTTTS